MQRVFSALFHADDGGLAAAGRVKVCGVCNNELTPVPSPTSAAAAGVVCPLCGMHTFCSAECCDKHASKMCTLRAGRTPCRHRGWQWCVDRAARGVLRGFVLGAGGKAATSVVFTLLATRSVRRALAAAASRDSVRFGLFLGGVLGSSGVRCAVSHLRGKDDKWSAAVSGVVGGLSLGFDAPSRRGPIGLYFLCRALYAASRSAMRQGWMPTVPEYDVWMFGVANSPIMYSFLLNPDLLDRSYLNWILNMGALTNHAMQWSLRDPRALPLPYPGAPPNFRRCDVLYHPGMSCLGAHSTDWVKGLWRGLKIYFPVHALPLLLFRLSTLRKAPVDTTLRLAASVRASCLFITTYVFIVKQTMCVLRTLRRQDAWWHPALAGLLTSLSMLLEAPKRRTELVLYCLPHAARAVWRLALQQRLIKPSAAVLQHGGVAMFCAAAGIILALDRRDFRPAFQVVLRLLVGDAAGFHFNPSAV